MTVCPTGGAWVRVHVAGFVLALIEAERRVLVVHQGDVGEDSVEPAVDAHEQVEETARV